MSAGYGRQALEHGATRRGLLRGLAGALPPALALAGCAGQGAGSGQVQPAPGGPPAEVTFMRPADQVLTSAYQAQADAFNKQQTRLKASFDAQAGADYNGWPAKLTTMLASDSAPDCFLLQQDMLPSFAANGTLLTLDPLLSRDAKEVDTSDFFPAHLEGGKWRGKQVAITPDGCAILEYYNVNLFQEAGVPAPKSTWSWNDYLEAARRLTKNDGAQIVQAGIGTVPSGNQLLPWLWSNGADVFSPDFKEVRVTEKPALDALQFVADLVQKHGVTVNSPGATAASLANTDGKQAMWRANRGAFGSLASVTSFKFNVVPIARSPQGGSATVTTPGHIGIAKSNKRPDAAWEWLKFLTGKQALVIRSEIAGGCPSRKSATQDPSYRDYTMPALESKDANKTFADVLVDPKSARFVPSYVRMADALNILNKYAQAAFKGEQSVPAAMDGAKRELDELLRQFPQPQA